MHVSLFHPYNSYIVSTILKFPYTLLPTSHKYFERKHEQLDNTIYLSKTRTLAPILSKSSSERQSLLHTGVTVSTLTNQALEGSFEPRGSNCRTLHYQHHNNGRLSLEDHGQDLRIKRNASAHAGLRCCRKDQYVSITLGPTAGYLRDCRLTDTGRSNPLQIEAQL